MPERLGSRFWHPRAYVVQAKASMSYDFQILQNTMFRRHGMCFNRSDPCTPHCCLIIARRLDCQNHVMEVCRLKCDYSRHFWMCDIDMCQRQQNQGLSCQCRWNCVGVIISVHNIYCQTWVTIMGRGCVPRWLALDCSVLEQLRRSCCCLTMFLPAHSAEYGRTRTPAW